MSCHGSVRIELPGIGGIEKNGPKVKKSQEGSAGERIYFETKYKTPFSQSVHIQRNAKGRNDILPFHPQNCPLTKKCPFIQERELSSQHRKRNDGVEGRESGGRVTCF